jgi:hypothetical protein
MEKRNLIQVSLPGIHQDYVRGAQKVFYRIKVEYGGDDWEVQRRYNEFDQLNTVLKFHFSNLPTMPGKSFFAIKKPEDIEKRRSKLEIYLKLLVQREEVYANKKFAAFLELDKNADDVLLNQPSLCGRLTHPAFGYRDVHMVPEKNLIFILTSQMDAGSRYLYYLLLNWLYLFRLLIYF